MRSAYLQAMLDARMAGYYIPEVIDIYLNHNWHKPLALALDFGY